jgi:phosphatidylserine/phosphatidylglycerophosphate/cardiolipin synthase-like enzyme
MAATPSALVLSALLAAVGCAATDSGSGSGSAGGKADDLGRCQLSDLGLQMYEAAADADPTQSAVPASRILTYDNEVGRALLDGGEIFPPLGDLIAGARHTVSIAMFVWEVDSDAHREIERGLVELAQNAADGSDRIGPVRVRILVNAITPIGQPRRFGESISRAIMALQLDPDIVRVDVATRDHTGFGAMHLKLAIVDDFAVHLGGANVEAVHDWTDAALPWRDSAYTVYGEIARSMSIEFAALWGTANEWDCSEIDCHKFPAFPVTPSGVNPERAYILIQFICLIWFAF